MVQSDTPDPSLSSEKTPSTDSPVILSDADIAKAPQLSSSTSAPVTLRPSASSSFSKPASSSSRSTTTVKKMILGGIEYELEATPKPAQPASVALYTKASRAKLDIKEKTDLFERATAKKLQTKFTMMNLKLDDPDKLDDTYNLSSAIDQMKENHLKYDLHDVFNVLIIDPKDPTNVLKQVDLYTDYGSVTVDDVAKSNCFYSTMVRDPLNAINKNLKLTKTYLANNTADNLVLKINETYLSYPETDRGGPLFFKLLMDLFRTTRPRRPNTWLTL
jgi:hypothetical protein